MSSLGSHVTLDPSNTPGHLVTWHVEWVERWRQLGAAADLAHFSIDNITSSFIDRCDDDNWTVVRYASDMYRMASSKDLHLSHIQHAFWNGCIAQLRLPRTKVVRLFFSRLLFKPNFDSFESSARLLVMTTNALRRKSTHQKWEKCYDWKAQLVKCWCSNPKVVG